MRSQLNGSQGDGLSIETMNQITPRSTNIQHTTSLEAKPCKSIRALLISHIRRGRLQNSLVWKLAKLPFSGLAWENDNHAGFRNVKTSENGLFLYKSSQANAAIVSRMTDYFFFGCLGGLVTGISNFFLLPVFLFGCEIPRKWAYMNYFTYHAELLPHTEQVIFHKVHLFGRQQRYIVDIRDLEKVSADMVFSEIIWMTNMFDS